MPYPAELLPRADFKLISSEDIPSKACFLRRSRFNTELDTFDELGEPYVSALVEDATELFGYSINILGLFEPFHADFCPNENCKQICREYWNESQELLRAEEIEFTIEQKIPLYLRLDSIYNAGFPYDNRQGNGQQEGRFFVFHKPTRCNFWHFEIHIIDRENISIRKSSAAWKKQYAQSFISDKLKHVFERAQPIFEVLEKRVYCKD